MFFLRQRRPERYAAEIRPGHPLYERIRREVLEDIRQEAEWNEEEILASIDRKIDAMREREEEAARLLLEDGTGTGDAASDMGPDVGPGAGDAPLRPGPPGACADGPAAAGGEAG
jgi:hypothetical protein